MIDKNNRVTVAGEVVEAFAFDHEILGEAFYSGKLKVMRLSKTTDIVPVLISERLIDVRTNHIGEHICIRGKFRSFNKHEGFRTRLVLHVFAEEVYEMKEDVSLEEVNNISLDGYICKTPIYRVTPLGREIADILLAVNRQYGKSDYIPCVVWGRNARFAENLTIGDRVKIFGRVQSRPYVKRISDTEIKDRVAYEVSGISLELQEGTDKKSDFLHKEF